MARPTRITDAQILESAHELFLEKGIEATTLEIAQHAGISEGTIFKRFKTKEQLFSAAMTKDFFRAEWFANLNKMSGQGDLQRNLELLASQMISFFEGLIPKIQVVMARNGHMKDVIMGNPQAPPVRMLKLLIAFIEREQDSGRLEACPAELLARLLLGATHHYAFMTCSEFNQWLDLSHEEFVTQTIDHLFGHLIVDSS